MLLLAIISACNNINNRDNYKNWKVYRGDDGINAYSGLDQINKQNVSRLQVAWSYRTGDNTDKSTNECNPIIIDGILYGVSPRKKTFALDAKTGKQIWSFDPYSPNSTEGGVSRGLCYWEDGNKKRIFISARHRLIAIDATTGKQVMSFGDSGYVDLRKGLRKDNEIDKYFIENTSPGVIYKNLLIVGSSMGETYLGMPGTIRAFDVITGKQKWIFYTIPRPGEFGYDTWPKDNYKIAGGCNAWSGLSIDRNRGMVFAATGSPSFDFHGGDRAGDNLFANSVIAINAATGKYIWHFQVSHHDLWDYDLPSPPNLITLKRAGKDVDAVVQLTKQGWIFIFDRETGKPLFPVEERPVPPSSMPEEVSSPTQPFPLMSPTLARQHFDTSLITNISSESHDTVMKQVLKYTFSSIYHPPGKEGIIQIPGFRGGAEWSGGAFDPATGRMYVGANDIPNVVELVELKKQDPDELYKMPVLKAGQKVYMDNCSVCHGADRKGNGPFPALIDIRKRLNVQEAAEIVEKGRSKMPSFVSLPIAHREAVIAYLFGLKNKVLSRTGKNKQSVNSSVQRKQYKIKAYAQLKDQFGYPGIKPPWGTLNAVDLASGKIVWKRTLGEYPELTKKGIPETGTQLFGGGIVTAGGLIFIGASKDEKFRAIDKVTGKTIWEYKLPAGGYATPATYEVDGKQYVVIAAGGGGFQATKSGDYYIAFALPDK